MKIQDAILYLSKKDYSRITVITQDNYAGCVKFYAWCWSDLDHIPEQSDNTVAIFKIHWK